MGDAIVNYLMAVGIRMKSRPMERAAFFAALNAKQLRGAYAAAGDMGTPRRGWRKWP